LEGSADKSKGGTDYETIDTTDFIGEPAADETTDDSAEIVLYISVRLCSRDVTAKEE
jgi:hypothetical protein